MPIPRPFITSAKFAGVATAVALLAAIGKLFGKTSKLADALFPFLETAAVIWATKFAADGITAIASAERSSSEPLLQLVASPDHSERNAIAAEVHNLGKGAAVAVSLFLWRPDNDGLLYAVPAARQQARHIAPGTAITALFAYSLVDRVVHDEQPFAIEAMYDSANDLRQRAIWFLNPEVFQPIGSDIREFPIIRDASLTAQLTEKARRMRQAAGALTAELRATHPSAHVSAEMSERGTTLILSLSGESRSTPLRPEVCVSDVMDLARAIFTELAKDVAQRAGQPS